MHVLMRWRLLDRAVPIGASSNSLPDDWLHLATWGRRSCFFRQTRSSVQGMAAAERNSVQESVGSGTY